MEFNDVLGLGKILPIEKLLDVIQKATGRISKSYFDKKDIQTEALRIRELAKAKSDEITIIANAIKLNNSTTQMIEYKDLTVAISPGTADADLSLEKRAIARTNYQQQKKQLNIESISSIATQELLEEKEVSNEPVDEDWISRFFKIAEDISSQEMQALWGKILAGEIKQPNSYSLRTLELIKNISQKEAELFTEIAQFAITSNTRSFFLFCSLWVFDVSPKIEFNFPYNKIALLKEIGLIQNADLLSKKIPIGQSVYLIGNRMLILDLQGTEGIELEVYEFTTSGNQLLTLISKTAPAEYLSLFKKSLLNSSSKLQEADFVQYVAPHFHYENLKSVNSAD